MLDCKYRTSYLQLCKTCGKREQVYKCKKINLVIGRYTCRFCKYYEKKNSGGDKVGK